MGRKKVKSSRPRGGSRGPAPAPAVKARLSGSWRGQVNRDEPEPRPGRPRCPSWMDRVAKRAWRELVPQLDVRMLAQVDRNALARYCTMFSQWHRAQMFLQEHGDTYPVRKIVTNTDDEGREVQEAVTVGRKAHPQVRIAARLNDQLLRLEREFGLTPSARARIVISDKSTGSANTKLRFFDADRQAG